jgi:hypothetical protein
VTAQELCTTDVGRFLGVPYTACRSWARCGWAPHLTSPHFQGGRSGTGAAMLGVQQHRPRSSTASSCKCRLRGGIGGVTVTPDCVACPVLSGTSGAWKAGRAAFARYSCQTFSYDGGFKSKIWRGK